MKKFSVNLSHKDIEMLKAWLGDYSKFLKQKTDELARRLAEIGVQRAEVYFAEAQYDGVNDTRVHLEHLDEGSNAVVAEGLATVFIEFGSGLIGYGYPPEELNGLGPGTYSDTIGKGQWANPEGWIYDHHQPRSHGNPPAAAMYKSRKEVEQEILNIVEEVFDFYA